MTESDKIPIDTEAMLNAINMAVAQVRADQMSELLEMSSAIITLDGDIFSIHDYEDRPEELAKDLASAEDVQLDNLNPELTARMANYLLERGTAFSIRDRHTAAELCPYDEDKLLYLMQRENASPAGPVHSDDEMHNAMIIEHDQRLACKDAFMQWLLEPREDIRRFDVSQRNMEEPVHPGDIPRAHPSSANGHEI